MSTFLVNIVTPNGIVYDQDAIFLVANTEAGSLGILPKHAPLIAPLKIDAVRIDLEGDKKDWVAVNGGIIEVRDNVVSILANSAEKEGDIDVSRAKEAKERAEGKIARAKEEHDETIDMDRAKVALYRAINRLNVADKER
ncbi:F0F1 ATP synthase subunit epsilon [Vagococcus jeotgali]|uniref:F0F1 ATP synthase subunit epsilon n=1 Tax=Vagococcus jeotgali TaxID=3109030 RepID=UPI002DDA484C|nr:F0F1 ATP synthase subunit epsilon [Vagococcus sp. B2T-5]